MHGGPGLGHAGGQGVAHGVPPGEGGQEGGVGVEDPAGEGIVDRLARTVPKPAITTTSTVGLDQGGGDRAGVAVPVEARTRSRRRRTRSTSTAGTDGRGRHVERPAGPVGDDQAHRQAGGEDGLQDGAASRDQDADPDAACGRCADVPVAGVTRAHATSAPGSRSRPEAGGARPRGGARGPERRGPPGLPPERAPTSLGPPAQGMPLVQGMVSAPSQGGFRS